MAQAIVDPVELRRCAHHLKLFNAELRDRLSALHGQMTGLGDTWRDREHDKFIRAFEQTTRMMEHFLATADEHTIFLLRKAQRIEEYLQQQ